MIATQRCMDAYRNASRPIKVGTDQCVMPPTLRARETPAKSSSPATETAVFSDTRPTTILVIDDCDEVREVVSAILRCDGHSVIEADGATQAITAVRQAKERIGLVLSDIYMPEMDGRDLSKLLRKQLPHAAFAFMTGSTTDHDVHDWLATRRANTLTKPFTTNALRRLIANVFSTPNPSAA